jgi:hypothetical protein
MTETAPLLSAPRPLSPRAFPLRMLAGGVSTGTRRTLQLVLAGIWLIDGILQFQPVMFTKNFAQMIIYPTIAGNPGVIASPMTRVHQIILDHPVGTNTAFAAIQLALGLAIACRPTVKLGLAASIPWAVSVWWFGEGLGGVLNGNASPLTGAPGGVILYALLAVLLWPAADDAPAPFPAAGRIGAHAARALWLVLWGSLAYFALQPGNTGPDAIHDQITAMVEGEPNWLTALLDHAANLTAGHGMAIAVALAVVLGVIAVSVYAPWPRAVRAVLVLSLVCAAAVWVFGEAFGGVFLGMGTDPNTGPLLALLALAYWPARAARDTTTPARRQA